MWRHAPLVENFFIELLRSSIQKFSTSSVLRSLELVYSNLLGYSIFLLSYVTTFSFTAHNYIYKLNLKPDDHIAESSCTVAAVSRVGAAIDVETSPMRARVSMVHTGVACILCCPLQ